MVWKEGESGNPTGRPLGTKNKNCVSLRYWFNLIAECAEEMPAQKKIDIAFRASELLLPKVTVLPADPEADPLALIKKLEQEKESINAQSGT